MTPRSCDGIIFDSGDILYDATPWRCWLTGELGRLGVKVTYSELVSSWESLLEDVYRGKADYWERFSELLSHYGISGVVAGELTTQARKKGKLVQVERAPFDGVAETLATLRESGLKLGVLSDTESPSGAVREGLDALGLARYFDAFVSSCDIGHVKPEREAYLAAMAAIGLTPERCVFVGHDADELEGAQAAGLFAIAFNADATAPCDARIQEFSHLVYVLGVFE